MRENETKYTHLVSTFFWPFLKGNYLKKKKENIEDSDEDENRSQFKLMFSSSFSEFNVLSIMQSLMMMMNLPDTAPQILDCHAHTGWPCSHDHILYKKWKLYSQSPNKIHAYSFSFTVLRYDKKKTLVK